MGRVFAAKGDGAVVNITSIGGGLPLSRALAYSNGKAAADSFTRWLAVHMATTYAPKIRVNAVAPGFMITTQNRFLLLDEASGELTDRGQTILENVPMARFGDPHEVVGAALWLFSDAAAFVTGRHRAHRRRLFRVLRRIADVKERKPWPGRSDRNSSSVLRHGR